MAWIIVLAIALILIAAGGWVYAQREIRRSRELLKSVDRDKLKDLDNDGWDDPR